MVVGGSMSKYREQTAPYDVDFADLEIIKKLLKTKKLTDRQKDCLKI